MEPGGRWQTLYMQQLLHPSTAEAPATLLPAEATARMQQQLSSVAHVVNSRVGSLTLQRQHKIWGELANFLAPYGIGVDAATPEDVCRFLDSQYQHEHNDTVLPDGRIVAAPHSMQNARSALSAVFRLQGCSQPWSDLEGTGNPCDSLLVSQ